MTAIGNGSAYKLWLEFCPLINVEDIFITNEALLLNEKKHGDTQLLSYHFHMAVMFIAYVLAQIFTMPIHLTYMYGTDDNFLHRKLKISQTFSMFWLYLLSEFLCISFND